MSSVIGVVVDEAGNPIAGARVSITNPLQRGCSIVYVAWNGNADSEGRFEASNLAPGEYDVVAAWSTATRESRHASAPQVVRTGDTNIQIVLTGGGTITGRVVLDGAPLQAYGIVTRARTA